MMLKSIQYTRKLRAELGFRVSATPDHKIYEIDAPWVVEDITESDFLKKYHTNSYSRRTDDVVWLWCTADLLKRREDSKEWAWFYDTGKYFFSHIYNPFFDSEDGLYFGQASFVDVGGTGYPEGYTIQDSVLIKSLSTNCLYVQGFQAMAEAAQRLNKPAEMQEWEKRRDQLETAIKENLQLGDGRLSYFKDFEGRLQNRRNALGTALAVLSDIIAEDDVRWAVRDYPVTDGGVPLFHPFFPQDKWYHNNSSWPFVDTFFIKAMETSDKNHRTALNAALLARTCVRDGTFHEVTDYRTREVKGSGSQLWTAAAFIDTCQRAGLVKE